MFAPSSIARELNAAGLDAEYNAPVRSAGTVSAAYGGEAEYGEAEYGEEELGGAEYGGAEYGGAEYSDALERFDAYRLPPDGLAARRRAAAPGAGELADDELATFTEILEGVRGARGVRASVDSRALAAAAGRAPVRRAEVGAYSAPASPVSESDVPPPERAKKAGRHGKRHGKRRDKRGGDGYKYVLPSGPEQDGIMSFTTMLGATGFGEGYPEGYLDDDGTGYGPTPISDAEGAEGAEYAEGAEGAESTEGAEGTDSILNYVGRVDHV